MAVLQICSGVFHMSVEQHKKVLLFHVNNGFSYFKTSHAGWLIIYLLELFIPKELNNLIVLYRISSSLFLLTYSYYCVIRLCRDWVNISYFISSHICSLLVNFLICYQRCPVPKISLMLSLQNREHIHFYISFIVIQKSNTTFNNKL